MRGTIRRTYDSIRTSSSSSAQCFDIETKPISVMAYVIRSEDVHHTLQVADSIFKSKTRSLLFRPLDRRSPNQECKDTIHIFFLQDSILHTLSPSCSFSAKATVETATAALDCGADGAAQDADFSAGLSFGMDLPKTITTLQRNCPTKTRAPHCQVMRGLCGHIYSFIYPPTLIVCHDRWKQLRAKPLYGKIQCGLRGI